MKGPLEGISVLEVAIHAFAPSATTIRVERVEHDDTGKVALVPAPAQFDGIVPTLGRAPGHDAHTDDVLTRECLDSDTIADLRKRDVVR